MNYGELEKKLRMIGIDLPKRMKKEIQKENGWNIMRYKNAKGEVKAEFGINVKKKLYVAGTIDQIYGCSFDSYKK